MASNSFIIIGCILAIFLLVLVLAALLVAGKLRKKTVPVYIDDDPRDNIMPYHDEGKFLIPPSKALVCLASSLSAYE